MLKLIKKLKGNMTIKKKLEVTIGTDPELFLMNSDNKIVPAFLFVKGTKDNPEPISGDGHAIQYDNVMLEYNVPPCKTEDEFIKHNKFVLDYVKETICKPNGLELAIIASSHLDEEYLSNPISNEMGCSADYNAYTQEQNVIVRKSQTLRSCGGHIHVSFPGLNYEKALKVIQALDLFVSVPLVLLEVDSERKQLYGKAGAFRFKEVNKDLSIVEYRSPSNFWLSSEKFTRFIYQQVIKAVEFVEDDGIITNPLDIINAINDNSETKAKEILEDYNIEINEELFPDKVILKGSIDSDNRESIYTNDSLGG